MTPDEKWKEAVELTNSFKECLGRIELALEIARKRVDNLSKEFEELKKRVKGLEEEDEPISLTGID